MTEKLQTSQGYIIRILQHFATKLWNITNFVMLFQAVMKFLSRSKFSLMQMVHSWVIDTILIDVHATDDDDDGLG
jgi:valyl-tRNA synthetase